jgi:WD40 repeat protein
MIKSLTGHMDTVTSLDYDLAKLHLWSVGADRTVRVWDVFHGR